MSDWKLHPYVLVFLVREGILQPNEKRNCTPFQPQTTHLQSLLPLRYAGAMVVQNLCECKTSVTFKLSPTPGVGAHDLHCLHGWEPKNG